MTLFKPTGGGNYPPTAPSVNAFTRQSRDNGLNPIFDVTIGQATYSWKSSLTGSAYYTRVYKTSDNSFVGETLASNPSMGQGSTSGTTLAAGTSYYVKVQAFDNRLQVRGPESSASSSLVALTLPANVGTVTLNGGTNSLSASWSAVNAGGDSSVTYYYSVFTSAGTFYAGSTTTSLNFSMTGVPAGNYYARVYAQNTLGAQSGASSQSGTVSVIAPPFFPFFPSFGPFFPFFPSFGPYFPYFGGPFFGGFY